MVQRAIDLSASCLDIEKIRRDFPGLHQEVHGKKLVYLDNAATGQICKPALDAITHFQLYDRANIHRGVHLLSQRATDAYEATREKVRAFINAKDEKEIVFVRGTTEAINLVAWSFAAPSLKPGDEILVTWMEHHSNIVPWQLLESRTGVKLKVVPVLDDGSLDMEAFEAAFTEKTRLVSVVHISNALGTINPVSDIVEMAHARGVPVLLDGAQAIPHTRVDVQALGCDFYAFSGHKMFGPTGIGVLYGRAELLDSMIPFMGGGDMIRTVSFEGSTFNEAPSRFEAGTPNISGVIGLGAAVDYLESLDFDAITAHEADLLAYTTEAMQQIPGIRPIGTAAHKASVFSFVLECAHPHDIGTIVDLEGVAIRTGHHCAQPIMERFEVSATARASFAFYNQRSEVDALVAAVQRVVEVFG
jgi:cysteine desulfurase/selenocysteine lyase